MEGLARDGAPLIRGRRPARQPHKARANGMFANAEWRKFCKLAKQHGHVVTKPELDAKMHEWAPEFAQLPAETQQEFHDQCAARRQHPASDAMPDYINVACAHGLWNLSSKDLSCWL